MTDLKNLDRRSGALADIGPDLNLALLWATAFPYGPNFADRITQGDYINLYAIFDLTYPRLKKTLLLGTRWGDENAKLIPAPGDPYYLNYSYDPMMVGVAPPPAEAVPAPAAPPGQPMPPMSGPLLPVTPPPTIPGTPQQLMTLSQIFAGPYGGQAQGLPAPAAPADDVAPAEVLPVALPDVPMPPVTEPLVPVAPPSDSLLGPDQTTSQIFAGPYGAEAPAAGPRRTTQRRRTDSGRWWLMLTRFVRNQLIIFTIASIVGVAVMLFTYMQVPTLLGLGRINVKLELPAAGGLYKFSNVTYRGVQIGKVTDVKLTENGAVATLTLDTSPKIPADLQAEVRSVSAVGEQYVDLRPRTDSGPYLRDGSVIAKENTTIPQAVGPMLDQVSSLVDSLPKDRLSDLLDESFKAFNGAGPDFQSLLDSASKVTGDVSGVSDQTRALLDDAGPLLDSQAETTEAIRTWARSLSGVTAQIAQNDPQVRAILQRGPGFAQEVSTLLNDVKPTLPILLANLTTLGQILLTYNPSLEQLLVLLPAVVAQQQGFGLPRNNPTGLPGGDFSLTIADPPACTVGFLPPSQWRSPEDQTSIDTPDGLYCKLPQDSPLNVRGARNYPCMGHPGKRAPTVQLCDDPNGYQPLSMRQHTLGPYPFDPNLIAQGIPQDDRVDSNERMYAPVEGTPLPPGAVPSGTPPDAPAPGAPPPGPPPAAPVQAPIPPPPPPGNSLNGVPHTAGCRRSKRPGDGAVPAAPSAFNGNDSGVLADRLSRSRITTHARGTT